MTRMIINTDRGSKNETRLLSSITRGRGKINATSTSKTKNKTDSKKNRKEKGMRDFDKGSNPHSNGDIFSLVVCNFIWSRDVRILNRRGIIIAIINVRRFIPIGARVS